MHRVLVTEHFKKYLKRLVKKNRFLKQDIRTALLCFHQKSAISLGAGIFKVRVRGWNSGKSSGYRLYIYSIESHDTISPIFIHAKNEQESIEWDELMYHVLAVKTELYQMYGWILD